MSVCINTSMNRVFKYCPFRNIDYFSCIGKAQHLHDSLPIWLPVGLRHHTNGIRSLGDVVYYLMLREERKNILLCGIEWKAAQTNLARRTEIASRTVLLRARGHTRDPETSE